MVNRCPLVKAIAKAENIAIFTHSRPDGDTLGSAFALSLALKSLKKTAHIYCADKINEKFNFLSEVDSVKCLMTRDLKENYDMFISVDCSDELRMGDNERMFKLFKNTANIDHHPSNAHYAKYNMVDASSSSTCQIVYKLIKSLNVEITGEIATSLFVGLSTDTGNFSHSNTDCKAFADASELVSKGVDVKSITSKLYSNKSKNRVKLLGASLSNIRFFENDKIAIMTVLQSDLDKCEADSQDTEGFIDYAIGINTVDVAAAVLQNSQNSYKVSFRSQSVDVCSIAETFGGGGHKLASGCRIDGFYEDVIDKLVKAIRDGM